MFGLRQQVRGDEPRVRGIVGDHQHLGRTRRQIDGRAGRIRRDDLLGGRHPGVAGAEDLVHLAHAVGAEGQRGDGLRPAHLVDGVDAAELGGDQHGGM